MKKLVVSMIMAVVVAVGSVLAGGIDVYDCASNSLYCVLPDYSWQKNDAIAYTALATRVAGDLIKASNGYYYWVVKGGTITSSPSFQSAGVATAHSVLTCNASNTRSTS